MSAATLHDHRNEVHRVAHARVLQGTTAWKNRAACSIRGAFALAASGFAGCAGAGAWTWRSKFFVSPHGASSTVTTVLASIPSATDTWRRIEDALDDHLTAF
jgi:hypothetical protein